jgi:EAL domain-containing protein (putative c-di-GMP-specific phosphodiesterase class I)
MLAVTRYLALAFASADLLIEVDAARRVVFAMGALADGRSDPARELVGRHIAELVSAADAPALAKILGDLTPAKRIGPIEVRLRVGSGGLRRASICAFALPELAPNISCSIAYLERSEAERTTPSDVLDALAFQDQVRDLLTAAASRGRDLSLALIEIHGLIEAQRNLAPGPMAALMSQIGGLVASHGAGGAATGLSDNRYALIQEQAADLNGLMKALNQLSTGAGAGLTITGQSAVLSPNQDPLHQFRAVRAALDCFLQAGLPRDEASLRRSFASALEETSRSAGRLGSIVEQRRFDLYYQPVVDLETELATHYEVLVRFDKNTTPAAMIKLAEDLEMIESLDAAVVEQAVRRLRSPGSEALELAVNVSGGTLLKDSFLERLLTATHSDPRLRKRLQLEITESATLHDLDGAARRIGALAQAGFMVSIDDLGAGAASYDYVRSLPVHAVKIDGRYIRGLDRDTRAQSIVKHLVQLCNELKLTTVAEMIEREEELVAVRQAGVQCGQGWLFGKAEPEPCPPRRKPVVRARRMGERESWG